jgi:transposase
MESKVVRQNVGCDLSKDDFKVCFHQMFTNQHKRIKGSRTFKNLPSGFKELVKWIDKRRDSDVELRLTMEATGVYYEQLVHYLNDNTDYYISVVLPNKTKAFFKSLNIKTKTDKMDAKILGQMGLERDIERWKPLSSNMRIIKQLSRDRISLVEHRTALLNRLHALKHSYSPHPQVIKRLKQQIKLLDRQEKEVEKQIKQCIKTDLALKERIDKICKVHGLGLVTVATIIGETGGFALFTSRSQVISYSGYDVVENQSGSSIKGKTRISKKGNKYIRRALHFPALVIIRYDPNFKQLYDRVYDRTKIKMKGLVAVQRKLLLLIYTLFKNNKAYDINYKNNTVTKNCRQDTTPAYSG